VPPKGQRDSTALYLPARGQEVSGVTLTAGRNVPPLSSEALKWTSKRPPAFAVPTREE
jgi:hypothetical protein